MTKEEIFDVIHKTIYQFFDECEDGEETPMSDKDKLLLKVNKAICNNLKDLDKENVIDDHYWKGFYNGIRTEKFRKSKQQESCDDVMAINTQGLDEGIRCAMCTNSMKSDRGCDGGCMVDDKMYKKVMEVINKQMFELPVSDDCVSRQAILDNAYAYGNGPEPEGYCVEVEDIQALPPVIPAQNESPVDKELPESNDVELEEGIKRCEEVADTCEFEANKYDMSDSYESYVAGQEGKCAEEHRQLAKWLKELKQLREQTRWIPISEGLPKEHIYNDGFVDPSEPVLVQLNSKEIKVSRYWGSRESYKDKPWIDLSYPTTLEVVAWMPLPGSYNVESEGEWIAIKNNIYNTEWQCSTCGNSVYSLDPWLNNPYCPKCGNKKRIPKKVNGFYDWGDILKNATKKEDADEN